MQQNRPTRLSADERFKDAVPEPNSFTFVPTYEEYSAWCRHPVTAYVATALTELGDKFQSEWNELSWNSESHDPLVLVRYRALAEAYRSFAKSKRDDYVAILQA
jgi:flavorubredoxin